MGVEGDGADTEMISGGGDENIGGSNVGVTAIPPLELDDNGRGGGGT